MPDSGYGMIPLVSEEDSYEVQHQKYTNVLERAKTAMHYRLFAEWLECFLAAWEATGDANIASWAGLEEWDM